MSRTAAFPLDPIARRELAAIAAESIAKGSKSFAAAARLFDRQTRQSAMMLYAWCRHCDDAVDGQHLGFARRDGIGLSPEARLEEIEARTAAALAGEPAGEPAFQAIAEVAARHSLPRRVVLDHLAGYRMDVERRCYGTIHDTLDYCYHVAGVVGVMMAMVMGAKDEDTLDRASDLGIAFQLTNIARDLVEDARAGRVYLPADWLDEVGLPPGAVADPHRAERVAVLARRLVELAEPYYASSLGGLSDLPLRSAWAVAMARGVYRAIGLRVTALGAAAWGGRVSTGRRVKLGHAAAGARIALASRRGEAPPRPPGLWTRPRHGAAG